MASPYTSQPSRAFWKTAIAGRHYAELEELWTPPPLYRTDRVATAGSCFAQHIGNNLAARGANFMDLEPAPPMLSDPGEARRFGFGVYSCRYGNIYTTRQLLQLFDEAFGRRVPEDCVWHSEGRYFDALRPGIDPVGQGSPEIVQALRAAHLKRVREMFLGLDLFVFTLGLTEGWENVKDGTMYPVAPGTIAGNFDVRRHRLRNLRQREVLADMEAFWTGLRDVNPHARMLLTVSPVPLTATATDAHVLPATIYSKSTLRSAAGELAEDHDDIHYFPSYEIVSSHPGRGMFFNPDQRTVNKTGVDCVMSHFFSGELSKEFSSAGPKAEEPEIVCDEEAIEHALGR